MYETIYSIGCFDHFHSGHIKLLTDMRKYGKKLIIGVHDDESLSKLKNLKKEEIDNELIRMKNVKKYAEHVYLIKGTDPTPFIQLMLNQKDNKESSCYIRGDDMKEFPSREFVEKKISIKFLPYTKGISSTQIRKEIKEKMQKNDEKSEIVEKEEYSEK